MEPGHILWNGMFVWNSQILGWETCQEQAYSVDGSKLKTPHLVRGVHVWKDKNYAFYDFVLMEDLEYAALLRLSHHQAFWSRKKGREEFKAGESSSNSLPRQEARGSGNSDKKRRPSMLWYPASRPKSQDWELPSSCPLLLRFLVLRRK